MLRAVIDDSVLHRNNKTTFELFWRIDIVEKRKQWRLSNQRRVGNACNYIVRPILCHLKLYKMETKPVGMV